MKINEGNIDRAIRGVFGTVLLVVGLVVVKGTTGIAAGLVGGILLATGIIGFCPLYALIGIDTNKEA